MIYSKEIIIPQNTLKTAPIEEQIDIVEGVVKKVWVRWRWGPGNLCGCRIYRESFQLWPTTLGQWFPSNVRDTIFEEHYIVADEPLHFRVEAYNKDDSFPHTLAVLFSVLRPEYSEGMMDLMEFVAYGGGI